MEFWGISEIWSFMPRTLYAALLPIPFLILFSEHRYKIFISSFLIGLLFNFHPISGLGGILIMLILLIYFRQSNNLNISISKFPIIFLTIALGMLPFLLNYFNGTSLVTDYNLNLYNLAFDERIPSYFKRVDRFFLKWLEFKTLFIIIPIFLLYILPKFYDVTFKHRNFILILFLSLFILPLSSIWVENYINSFLNLNLRMSFQIVRVQKLIVIPGYLALLYLFLTHSNLKLFNIKIVSLILSVYIVCIPLSSLGLFEKVPFVSDDLTKMILPNFRSTKNETDLLEMGKFIVENTDQNSTFYNQTILRTISERSVILDHKGASILIEGNPTKFIEWYKHRQNLKEIDNALEKKQYLIKIGVTHFLSFQSDIYLFKKVKSIGRYNLYELSQ
jgi:hypothetical protein